MLAEAVDKEYEIKRFSKDRIADLTFLHKAVYRKESPQNYFAKKYNTAYTGVDYLGYLAYNRQGIPVGYYGVMPCFVQYNDQILLAAQSGDTMTHPAFRYKGLFVELSKMTFDLCRENGIAFLFGFPNQNSYHGAVQKLGWQQTESMQRFTIAVNVLPLAAAAEKFRWLQPLYTRYTKLLLRHKRTTDPGVANSVVKEGYAGIYRDQHYFAYKASYSDAVVLEINNAKVWIRIKKEITVGDVDLGSEDYDTVLKTIKKIASKLGIRRLHFHACTNTQLHEFLSKHCQSEPSFPVLFQPLTATISFDQIKFTASDIDIF